MLQQTQADRVVPYFERFMARFPGPAELAAAAPAEVLGLWSGLGYNRRALRLQEAAGRIASEGWPRTAGDLQRLPGVGPYTAAAVACFAFGEPTPTPDTNLRRVLSRWSGRPLEGAELEAAARADMPPERASDWNQAIMDLGSLVCRPRDPSCGRCPVAAWCAGPETYVPPPKPGRFEGSLRQARGAVVRTLVSSPSATLAEIADITGLDPDRLEAAALALFDEGAIETWEGTWRLAGW